MSSERTLPRSGNWLLDALPDDEYELLAPRQVVQVARFEMFHEVGQTITQVYFPTSFLASGTALLDEGTLVEAITVGCEGMTSLPLVFGMPLAGMREMGQIPGEAIRVPARAVSLALEKGARFRALALRYADAVVAGLAQAVACNRIHLVENRAARWLLMTHDRVDNERLRITHEVLSAMLGTNRPTVTLALQQLQAAGLISYARGAVTLLDRAGLEEVSCECYGIVRTRFQGYRELLGVADAIPGRGR